MEQFGYVIWAVAGVILLSMLWRFFKTGSFAGMMFGAPVSRTVGEVEVMGRGVRQIARVYSLQSTEPSRAVGFELVSKTRLSFSTVPLALSKEQARQVAKLLEEAAAI